MTLAIPAAGLTKCFSRECSVKSKVHRILVSIGMKTIQQWA
jgi:hypothetical protein